MVKDWKLNIVKIPVLPELFFRFRGTCVEISELIKNLYGNLKDLD